MPEINTGNKISPNKPPRELDLSGFLFETFDTSKWLDINQWSDYYDEIPVDPYITEGFRYKAIGWFRMKHRMAVANTAIDEHLKEINRLSGFNESENHHYLSTGTPEWESAKTGYQCWFLPQYSMQQSKKYNPVHGDIRREYPPISKKISGSKDFQHLLDHYAGFFGWEDAIVLVQFQRVDCLMNRKGQPTIEGFHQDGNRHVGMLVVDRINITNDSGISQYVLDKDGKKTDEMIFNDVLPAGALVYWNDKRLWHYGTDLKVEDQNVNGGRGVRDIVILSAKTPPANMPMGPVSTGSWG
jgi:hypothetical protein